MVESLSNTDNGVRPGAWIKQPVLQRYLQTVSKKCDEYMRISAVFELMIDGPNTQFALQRPE
jgi:hypothetical protein